MHHPHDQRFKALMASFLEPLGQVELERAVHLAPPRIDVAFEPTPGANAPELGLLARMAAMGPCLIEYYSQTVRAEQVERCLRKRMEYAHERRVAASRRARSRRRGGAARAQASTPPGGPRRDDGTPPAAPRLWILSTGRPRKSLRAYEARTMDGWPAGCWQTRSVDQAHIVVLRDLPETPETLVLRLFARGKVLHRAIEDLAALPLRHPLRRRARTVMLAFEPVIIKDMERTGNMNALQKAQALYDEWNRKTEEVGRVEGRKEGRKEGREEGVRAVLTRLAAQRFGPLSDEARARIEAADLATLDAWTDRLLSATSIADLLG
ncbi:DUF4351 domain-containing protein [Haliangium sp.]|uniref:DUF4351 domain-containing protein n=1 Tax=Haliangium sp. TaxID=2663208 RepID=UPI003D0DE643